MRRRFIITTSVALILFAICLFGINVYASMTQNFSLSSKIGFTAPNVSLSLNCSVEGCKQSELTAPPSGSGYTDIDKWREAVGITHKEEYQEGIEQDWKNKSWEIKETLDFIDYKTEIVYKIEIKNYTDVKVNVKLILDDTTDSSSGVKPSDFIERIVWYGTDPDNLKEVDDEGFLMSAYDKETKVNSENVIYLKTKVRESTRSFTVANNFTLQVEAVVD